MGTDRGNLLINRPFQRSIIGWFSLAAAGVIIIFFVAQSALYYNLSQELTQAGVTSELLKNHRGFMSSIFLGCGILSFILIFTVSMILSHKVAGPIYRMTNYLKDHSPKSKEPLKFRKGDYFPELEQAFNEYRERA